VTWDEARAAFLSGIGLAAAVVAALSVRDSPVLVDPAFSAFTLGLFIAVWSVCGAWSLFRRPAAPIGLLILGAGFLAALGSLAASPDRAAFTAGRTAIAVMVVYTAFVFLAYPTGRLESLRERRLVETFALATLVLWAAMLTLAERLPATGPVFNCGNRCPGNALDFVHASSEVGRGLRFTIDGVTAAALAAASVLVVRKASWPSRLRRHTMLPIAVCASVWALTHGTYVLFREADASRDVGFLRPTVAVAAVAVPISMAFGDVLGRVFAARRLVEFVAAFEERITPEALEAFLRNAFGDPTLRLLLWEQSRESYVDVGGAPAALPPDGRAERLVVTDGRRQPRAAVIYDRHLSLARDLVEGLARTSLLVLENYRLATELGASRSRLVVAAAAERLRLERDLHDGAQQRLLGLQFALGDLREHVRPELRPEIDAIVAQASAAIEDLRELSQGIYPAVLVERGLGAALRAMAATAPIEVRVEDMGVGRRLPAVEYAVYLCVREAVQNAIKHGGPGVRVAIRLTSWRDELHVAVADDGAGFDPAARKPGTGIVSIEDRIGSVGGRLSIRSAAGGGTTVYMVVRGPSADPPRP
jgi:signal transduction histidine kinase